MRIPPRTGFIVSHRHLVLRRARGASTVKVLLLIPVALVLLLVLAVIFFEARKAYWDHQVKLMCEKDGGVKVYEKIILSKSQLSKLLNEYGQLPTPGKDYAKFSDPFFLESKDMRIRVTNPRLIRSQYDLYRAEDKKMIASAVTYGRSGGDFPTWAHDSSFSCTDFKGPVFLSFEKNIFSVQGE